MIDIVTWNVLHRVHAENWKEAPLALFPDERARIDGIRRATEGWLASGVDVVCLQEVSGDQRAALGAHPGAFVHTYPRVPSLRTPGPAALDDPREHLLTLAPRLAGTFLESLTFDTDKGKGLLAVDVGPAVVINTHVSLRGAAQLALLGDTARRLHASRGKAVIVLGDTNAELPAVRAALGDGFVVSEVKGHTRVATDDKPAHTIDHVAVLGGSIAHAEVLDGAGLSDHLPVRAKVIPR
jgi:endonuclease/exonuclease/phosphatase family metal-dependent hydrolase